MGNYSVIIAMVAFVIVGGMVLNSRDATQAADELLGENTYKNLSREASVTGLNMTLRQIVADTASWATAPTQYEFQNVTYQDASFRTRVVARYGSTVVIGRCVIDTIDVISTGLSDGGRTHEIRGTFVRTCSDPGGIPPFMRYVTISDRDLIVAGLPSFRSTNKSSNSDIHTNQNLEVTAKPTVEGFGSYTTGVKCVGNSCNGFEPNVNPAGTGEDNVIQRPRIELPLLEPSDYRHLASYADIGSVELADQTFDFTNFVPPDGGTPVTGYGTADNPFLWYINGSLTIHQRTSVRTLGHGIIIVNGSVHINASSNLYTSVADGLIPVEPPSRATEAQVDASRDWFAQYMPEDMTMGIYAGGDVHLNGENSTVMSYLYSNGAIHVNGKQTLIGAMTTRSEMQINGSDVDIWYAGINSSVTLPGIQVQLPDGIRMIAYSEW